jgi:hypothetical protein
VNNTAGQTSAATELKGDGSGDLHWFGDKFKGKALFDERQRGVIPGESSPERYAIGGNAPSLDSFYSVQGFLQAV